MNFIFHSIGEQSSYENVTEKQFKNFCQRLNSTINLGQDVLVTFDDGNKSDLLGFEIAKYYGLKTAHFVITKKIGQKSLNHYWENPTIFPTQCIRDIIKIPKFPGFLAKSSWWGEMIQ